MNTPTLTLKGALNGDTVNPSLHIGKTETTETTEKTETTTTSRVTNNPPTIRRGKFKEGYKHSTATKKVFIVLRGLPGCGADAKVRDLLTEAVEKNLRSVAALSTEDYFYNERGEYEFDKGRISECHRMNYARATSHFINSTEMVILNNYNIKKAHYRHYVSTAISFSYDVVEIVVGEIRLSPEQLKDYIDNCDGKVPEHVIAAYSRDFEP